MLLASLCTPGLDIFSVDGRLKTTLWPAKGGPSPISVRSVSSNTGLFCTVRCHPHSATRRTNLTRIPREAYSPAYPVLDDYNMARTKTKPIKVKKEKDVDKPEKAVDPEKPAGKKRRADPQGRKMLRKIKRAQQSTDRCIPRAAIKRLIREEVQNINGEIRLTSDAIDALAGGQRDIPGGHIPRWTVPAIGYCGRLHHPASSGLSGGDAAQARQHRLAAQAQARYPQARTSGCRR